MTEPARIVTSGKIKATIDTVKENIKFWNDLHHLGLGGYAGKSNAAAWTIANCVIAVRESADNLTEIFLLVARRQSDYMWTVGLYPDVQVQECWNQLFRLFPREMRGEGYQLIEPGYRKVSWKIELLARIDTPPRQALVAQVEERLMEKYRALERQRNFALEMDKLQEEIEQARAFKHDQEALEDLAPEQLAATFLQMIPEPRPVGRHTRTQPQVIMEPSTETAPPQPDGLPDLETMRQYYPDYSPETAMDILNAVPKAWKDREFTGGRW